LEEDLMPSRSIGITLVTTGLVAALVAPSWTVLRSTGSGTVAPDTLSAAWISEITMDPIRVVIPLEESATQESEETPPRR